MKDKQKKNVEGRLAWLEELVDTHALLDDEWHGQLNQLKQDVAVLKEELRLMQRAMRMLGAGR